MPKNSHKKIAAAYPFPSAGKGLIFNDQPIGVRFPPAISNYLRARKDAEGRKDTQDFVRAAVAEKLERDGINIEVAIDPTVEPAATRTAGYLQIPSPKFEMYESVVLNWNGQTAKGQITDRRYCFDGDVWEYQISGGQYAIGDYVTSIEPEPTQINN